MQKQIVITLCIILISLASFSQQSLTEDGKGESSLVFPNASLTINTTDPKATVSYYYGAPQLNLYLNSSRLKTNQFYTPADSIFIRKSSLLGGGAVSGKNEDGVSALFKDGKFTPGGEFSALFGGSFSLANAKTRESLLSFNKNRATVVKAIKKREDIKANLLQYVFGIDRYLKDSVNNIEASLKNEGLDVGLHAALKSFFDERPDKENNLKIFLNDQIINKWPSFSMHIRSDSLRFRNVIDATIQSIDELLQLEQDANNSNRASTEALSSLDKYLSNTMVIFGSGKYMVKGFTQYLPDSAIGSKFKDTSVSNGYLRIHVNYIHRQRKKGSNNVNYHIVGLSLGYNWKDNFDALKSISIQQDQVLYKDSFTTGKTSKTKDAKTGSFFYYRHLNFDIDYLAIRNFDEFSLLINPYFRSTFGIATKDSIIKTKLEDIKGAYRYRNGSCTLGTGLYFASPKNIFIGGVYFEYNAVPLQKPEVDANGNNNLSIGDKFKNNLNFGLVVKVNFFKFRYDKMLTDQM